MLTLSDKLDAIASGRTWYEEALREASAHPVATMRDRDMISRYLSGSNTANDGWHLQELAIAIRECHYFIEQSQKCSEVGKEWYRVVNSRTGEESALYTLSECGEIIRLALAGELKGSFDIPKG